MSIAHSTLYKPVVNQLSECSIFGHNVEKMANLSDFDKRQIKWLGFKMALKHQFHKWHICPWDAGVPSQLL